MIDRYIDTIGRVKEVILSMRKFRPLASHSDRELAVGYGYNYGIHLLESLLASAPHTVINVALNDVRGKFKLAVLLNVLDHEAVLGELHKSGVLAAIDSFEVALAQANEEEQRENERELDVDYVETFTPDLNLT